MSPRAPTAPPARPPGRPRSTRAPSARARRAWPSCAGAPPNPPPGAAVGLIPIYALCSPVRQVSYKVENTRVGQELDYDKLTLTVETDGTLSPDDAVAYAARILQDQLQLFVHFRSEERRVGH